MRPVSASLYGFLLCMVIAVGCFGLGVATGSMWFIVGGLVALMCALIELHESMP